MFCTHFSTVRMAESKLSEYQDILFVRLFLFINFLLGFYCVRKGITAVSM